MKTQQWKKSKPKEKKNHHLSKINYKSQTPKPLDSKTDGDRTSQFGSSSGSTGDEDAH